LTFAAGLVTVAISTALTSVFLFFLFYELLCGLFSGRDTEQATPNTPDGLAPQNSPGVKRSAEPINKAGKEKEA
jgi:hypothetical protein